MRAFHADYVVDAHGIRLELTREQPRSLVIELQRGGTIDGRVWGLGSTTKRRVEVAVKIKGEQKAGKKIYSVSEGRFEASLLAPGTYEVYLREFGPPATPEEIAVGEDVVVELILLGEVTVEPGRIAQFRGRVP